MFQKLDQKLVRYSHCRLVISGDIVELYEYERPVYSNFPPAEKSRGSGIKTKPTDSRRIDHLRRTRQTIRRTISTNATAWGAVPVFITYTFAENISDLKTANAYWQQYKKKLKYHYGKLKYLVVVEFQKRGAIHYHALYFNLPYIKNIKPILQDIWGHGFLQIKAVNKIENIGAYVSKYLQKENADSRLVGQKAFFVSRGLHKPIVVKDEYKVKNLLCYIPKETMAGKRLEFPTTYHGVMNYSQYRLNTEQVIALKAELGFLAL